MFGVFGGNGFEDGGVGTSGAELGIDGDVGGGGVCMEQAAAPALNAVKATIDKVDLGKGMTHSSVE
jgi:hypothetical protein